MYVHVQCTCNHHPATQSYNHHQAWTATSPPFLSFYIQLYAMVQPNSLLTVDLHSLWLWSQSQQPATVTINPQDRKKMLFLGSRQLLIIAFQDLHFTNVDTYMLKEKKDAPMVGVTLSEKVPPRFLITRDVFPTPVASNKTNVTVVSCQNAVYSTVRTQHTQCTM